MIRTRLDRRGLAIRLFRVQALVVGSGAVTLVVIAVAITPGLFRDHLHDAIGSIPPELAYHLDQALARALLISLALAVAAGLITALAVSWFMTRRLTAPITVLADAASRIADGDYGARVPPSRLGAEFALLDNAFNRMAAALHSTEHRRQELLADLAHELRTPLATLDSFLEAIEDRVVPTSDATWRTMHEQTNRLRRLVDDIDSVSQAEERRLTFAPHEIDLHRVVDEAFRAVASGFADKGVVLRRRHSPDPAWVNADPDRLREIFDNLLTNALRHTPSGGQVTVTTLTRGRAVESTVTDTGEGVRPEHLPYLFDRFFRVDPTRSRATGGAGIGLAIARALAHAHGGELRARSDGPGQGATFTLVLPTARDAGQESTRR
jgi:two-component system sensor histidine kinase BaeS